MKVLFAVNEDDISTQVVKKYQKEYKEIISYKNMYYFNAIIKELQRDKSYDRIVISEDLEPFANNNYDAIDKFLFEKLDNISDEATGLTGEDIPIILITKERREKSDPILVKLFGIGIYNALLGADRTIDNICKLINKPRGKKEAKTYYKIESDEVNYKSESEDNVSETEIKNILNHYKRLGKDEDRYIESFNNIAAQYNDAQLRIITKFLPLNVKAVLEERCEKYQSVMTFGDTSSTINSLKKQKEDNGLKIGFLNNTSARPTKPVIVPTAVRKVATKKIETKPAQQPQIMDESIKEEIKPIETIQDTIQYNEKSGLNSQEVEVKRGRGRPKKIVNVSEQIKEETPKRGRGRPKKVTINNEQSNPVLPGFDSNSENIEKEIDSMLPGFDNLSDETSTTLPGFENEKQDNTSTTLPGFDNYDEKNESATLPGFDEIENQNSGTLPGFDNVETANFGTLPGFDSPNRNINDNNSLTNSYNKTTYNSNANVAGLLLKDKKVVSFVGTTKNGTSFLVNNLAKCLSAMGIKTAILDLTTNRNSYYIYTNNDEKLRNIAYDSIKKLKQGSNNGIEVDKYLDVYTALPGDNVPLDDEGTIISTLLQKYSVVLMDCDFNTRAEYFEIAQEIYIVQTLDILTIQPMTAFLRDLKAKDILKPEKVRVVINKELKVRGLTEKAIIGGLAFYNDPAMAFMTELFNKDTVKYCTIPFEEEIYSKYLEGIVDCKVNISGYSKNFNIKLKELANMVYPLYENKYKPMDSYSSNNKFSASMNNTLEQMKNKY